MTSFTSESDSNVLAGEEIQRHFVLFFFSSSLTTDMNRNSQNPRVPVSRGFWHGAFASGVRVRYFFDSDSLFNNSLSSPVNGYSERR